MKTIAKNKKTFRVTGSDAPGIRNYWTWVEDNKWENDTFAVFDVFLDKNTSYIDIGAWIGSTVLYGCQIARHCYAVEPDPVAYTILKDNIDLNPDLARRITLFNGCIADRCGSIEFGTNTGFGDSLSSLLFDGADRATVESLTLEAYMERNRIYDCRFIKMDIEGGEAIVLPGIKEYLKKNTPTLLLSLHPFWFKERERDSLAIIDALKAYPQIYLTNGHRIQADELMKMMMSVKKGNCSIVATSKQNRGKMIGYRVRRILLKWANRFRRFFISMSGKIK